MQFFMLSLLLLLLLLLLFYCCFYRFHVASVAIAAAVWRIPFFYLFLYESFFLITCTNNGAKLYVYLTASNLQDSHIHSYHSRSYVPLLQSGFHETRLSYPFVMLLYVQIVCYFCVFNRLVTFHGVGRFAAGLWPVSNTLSWLSMMHYRMQGTRMCVLYVTCYMLYVL